MRKVITQEQLENYVNKSIKEHGEKRTIERIRNMPTGAIGGMFDNYQNYPYGVFVYCNSELGGLLVGKKD